MIKRGNGKQIDYDPSIGAFMCFFRTRNEMDGYQVNNFNRLACPEIGHL